MIPVKVLSSEVFRRYGHIIEPKDPSKVFEVLFGDREAKGWRIGYLAMGPSPVDSLEQHPESLETFEPVTGTSVLLVAPYESPDEIEAFLLDKPVCVGKKIWHGVSVISARAEIKITENYDVDSVHHKLKKPINIAFV